ncbi:condensation domain-containing protein [Streptomyces marispadix]|uniref:Condensation domain-containing protein n=1 Tax=Streptomyces marispadix TaxID=2922868 RepID=A0ABS9T609_9ACTN|nr:condensation domain-containing protein [Streptomyces marispadix]MCH6163957.1 condensation domain-containing protein [Streptomyces marispadix]
MPPTADYFSIGGNSVIALQLIERVLSRYGAALKLVDIYAHPLVSDLAGAITERMPGTAEAAENHDEADSQQQTGEREAPAAGAHRLPPVRPGQEPTLSYGQERMWFHHQLDPSTTLYNLPGASRLRGEPDLEALRLAWEDLAQRHEVLRSNFAEADGRPRLVIRPELGDFFRVLDVSGEPHPEAAARAAVQKETHWVFDVARDPLVRVTVVRIGPGDYLFCWTMHHGVNDGWAPQILMGELLKFYEARCEGRVHRPEPLPVQYKDYARWQRDLLEGSLLDGELDYWRRQLDSPPVLELPTDRPRAARMDFAGATHGFTVPAELVRKLRELGSRETATLFMVILTGLDVLLSRWSGQRDIVVGTPTIGRSRPELWGLLGFFNNTIALRSDLSGEPTFRELLRRVRAVVLGAMDNQEIPFDRVVREVAPDRDPSRNPIFDVMYVHQTLPPDFSFGESTFNPGRPGGEEDETPLFPGLPPGTAKFDLTFVVAERPDVEELEVALEYSTRLFDAGTVQTMTRRLLDLLWAAVDDPDVNHLELPAAPPEKTEQDGTGRGPGTDSGTPEAEAAGPETAEPAEPETAEPLSAAPAPAVPTPSAAVSACLRLRGDIDADALRAAFDDLTERHDVLRARFPVTSAQPLAPLARDGAAGFLSVVDVSGRTDPKAAARDLAAAHARTAVDPATGSPLRALLLTTGPADHILVVTTHRDVYDGAQPGVFFGDLLALYAARSGGLPTGPAALPVSYDDYAQWQRRLREDGLLDDQLAYWQRRLGSLRTFETTADRPRPMRGTYTGALHGVRLPAPLAREVIQAGARERLLACIATLLSLRSGADEAHIGLTESAPDTDSPRPGRFGAERPAPALGEILGPFANPLTLRIDTSGDLGLGNLAAHVREVIAGARGNADVPFDDVVRALRPARQPGREPLFDVTYAHHALPRDLGSAAGLDVRGVSWPGSRAARLLLPGEPGTSPYDLAWSVLEGPEPDALSISVEYRTELFDADTAAAVTDGVVTLLRLGMREPAVPLAELWRDAASPDAGPAAGPHPA